MDKCTYTRDSFYMGERIMKILITGASGLLGKNLVEKLKGHELLLMSRRLGFDLRDKNLTYRAVQAFQPDIVYHLAANAAESRGQVTPQDMTERNLNIFLNVLVPSINMKVKRFIYISSVAVYGSIPTPYSEDDICKPEDVYGVNKLACEQILKILAKVHGFEYVIFRPHNLYGPHQDMRSPYKNIVALIMRSILEDKEITLYGEGKMKRAFSYVEDVVEVLKQGMIDFKDQTLNVGSCIETEIADLVSIIEEVTGKKLKVNHLPARPQEIWSFLPAHRRQHALTSYHETPLREGLEKTWEALRLPDIEREPDEIYTR